MKTEYEMKNVLCFCELPRLKHSTAHRQRCCSFRLCSQQRRLLYKKRRSTARPINYGNAHFLSESLPLLSPPPPCPLILHCIPRTSTEKKARWLAPSVKHTAAESSRITRGKKKREEKSVRVLSALKLRHRQSTSPRHFFC